jgi:MFS transporter, DHA3 family, macrolide efflux protein
MSLMLVAFAVLLVSVPLARGQLRHCVDVEFRHTWALLASLGSQFLVLRVLRGVLAPDVLGLLHVGTYFFAGAFVWLNRAIPGIVLMALGGAANLAAISSNGGVMPAQPHALEVAGKPVDPSYFVNSGVVPDANLWFLGDIFAIPASWPFANVFSVGDVLLVVGAVIGIHRICQSRLVPSGASEFSSLRRQASFMRVWYAQVVSNLGDWSYTLAVASQMAGRTDAARVLVVLLICQAAPAGLAGLFGGPLVDRLARRGLMVTMDVVRAAAVISLFVVGEPAMAHLYVVAAILGVCGALFQPALQASIPNLVRSDQVVAANAVVNSTFNFAVMVGPVLGGLVAATWGLQAAFVLNAASFTLSAMILWQTKVPQTREARADRERPMRAVAAGLRYILGTGLIRGVTMTIGLVILAASVRSPLEPLLVVQDLGGDAGALGLAGGMWGLGMLLGSFAAPAAARRWTEQRVLTVGILAVGVVVIAASQAATLPTVLVFWIVAGAGNAAATITYESLLQRKTPDRLRGRVMAATDAIFHLCWLCGALAAGFLGSQLGVRTAYLVAGSVFLLAAVLSVFLVRQRREDAGSPQPAPAAVAATAVGATAVGAPEHAVDVLVVSPNVADVAPRIAALVAGGRSVRHVDEALPALALAPDLPPPACVVVDAFVRDLTPSELVARLTRVPGWRDVPVLVLLEQGTPPRCVEGARAYGASAALLRPADDAALDAAIRDVERVPALV